MAADREIITRRRLPHWYVPGAAHFITYRLAGTLPVAVLEEMRERKERLRQQGPPAGISPVLFRERLHKKFFAEYDRYLDRPSAIDWLAKPEVAAMVRGNLYHHNGTKYHLLAYCIMPNHVLLQPLVGQAASLAITPATPHPLVGQAASLAITPATPHPLVGQAASLAIPTANLSASEAACPTGGDETGDGDSPLAEIMHSLKSYTAHEANRILGRKGTFWQHESYDHWVRDEDELERIVAYIIGNPVGAQLVQRPHDWHFGSALDRFLHDGSCCGLLPS
ncbi:MAG: hypothetical protein HY289_04835 [Planctomycetes bacterium]|nr:hypothetical protein [Planctomycetota bacterium]